MGVVDESVEEHSASVVRLFPDHASHVLWFVGPVAYEDTALDERLVADLRAWDAAYEAGLARSCAWRSSGLATEHDRVGARLARRLADQIGDEFEVEHHCGEPTLLLLTVRPLVHATATHGERRPSITWPAATADDGDADRRGREQQQLIEPAATVSGRGLRGRGNAIVREHLTVPRVAEARPLLTLFQCCGVWRASRWVGTRRRCCSRARGRVTPGAERSAPLRKNPAPDFTCVRSGRLDQP